MGWLENVAAYLVTNGAGTTAAPEPTIVYDAFPASPDAVIVLRDTGGRAPIHTMGASLSKAAVEQPNLQVLTRAPTRAAAAALARSVWDLLDNYSGTMGSTQILHILAHQMPASLGRNEGFSLTTCNYTVRIAP